tara:strand:+ start:12056 stop:12853 length:798 start_codon:yes stop_codon:yes gene_type:complete
MDYVLFNNQYNKENLNLIVNRINEVEVNSNIYLISDEKWANQNVKFINTQKLVIKKLPDSLDGIVIPKILILNELVKNGIIENFIHITSDTVILKKFSEIENIISQNKINIMNINSYKLSYGYSYFDNITYLDEISDLFIEHASESGNYFGNLNKHETELSILKQIQKIKKDYFNLLPALPLESSVAFDPLGYGRYLLGSNFFKNKIFPGNYRFIDEDIGAELSSGRLKLKINNNKISSKWNDKNFTLLSVRSFWNHKLMKLLLK